MDALAHSNFASFLMWAGYLGLFVGVFVETGFLIGVIIPGGETLVFAAGLLSAMGYLNVWVVMGIVFAAAVGADSLEYGFGRKYGPGIFKREGSWLFDKSYIDDAQAFFDRHGGKTILLARFFPFIRTLAPALAGVGKMPYRDFFSYNVAGAALWAVGVTLVGYYLGEALPNGEQYIIAIMVAVGAASVGFSVGGIWHHAKKRRKMQSGSLSQ